MGYQITCKRCGEPISKYAGVTGRNLFMRGGEHLADCEKKTKEKPLWKHILEKHEGRMEGEIFEHFEMIQTGVFFKPQRRKANDYRHDICH